MSGQPSVLQVVILRDGLLVGTQVFMPGQYTLGSGGHCDVHLDDATVSEAHAYLYFQNGRAAIQDAGSGAVFVNGHRVNACEVRPVDEIACGPFTLKVRVMAQKAPSRPAPPPDVAAILGGAPEAPHPAVPAVRPVAPAPAVARSTPAKSGQAPATVVSSRRTGGAAPAPNEAPQARGGPHLRPVTPVPVEDAEQKTESMALGSELFGPTVPGGGAARRPDPLETVPLSSHSPPPAPARAVAPAPRAHPPAAAASHAAATAASPAHQPHVKAIPAPAPVPAAKAHGRARPQARHASGERPLPSIPSANEGRGSPNLFVELYWGETRKIARGFKKIDPKKKLVAREDDSAPLPIWGFHLEGKDFVFAEQKGDLFRVFIPPSAAVERRAQDGNFYPVQTETLEVGPDQRRCVTMGSGHALRLSGDDDITLVAYVQPAIPKPFVNPLRGLPWLALVFLALFSSAFLTFVFYFAEMPVGADFQNKNVNPVAVKLIAPPKPEEKKKLEKMEKKIEKAKKKPEKELPKVVEKKEVPAETKKALKSIEKLQAAGPAMKDLLAAVDKLGSGPGAKNAKNDFKLSGMIGKAPIASAGLGTFGLGGGGGGGMGIKGAELLRGKGGGGIGALGAGRIGKGNVAGTVTHAVSRNVGAQGTIDKEAVAKVINSHLHEVSSCYERALLKTPGLAGKIVLEWQITTSGSVGFAKTKSSSMQSPAVESCILQSLKTWRFPPAKGAGVIITYPFMFNSVGY
ncbi:MAG: AgmX/PglI C-terminal domain-containing protein [Myxococcales bacterium]|nr:AgmX/PglI C-terminal domain-containing protein [Myxococcales bacterium]